jgi:hypothetical protein
MLRDKDHLVLCEDLQLALASQRCDHNTENLCECDHACRNDTASAGVGRFNDSVVSVL